jgi:hypothetical protein
MMDSDQPKFEATVSKDHCNHGAYPQIEERPSMPAISYYFDDSIKRFHHLPASTEIQS